MRRLASSWLDVTIAEILEESMSARSPGRPIFDAMIKRIEKGEADGIIAWHPDRLARNSIDGGRLIYLLDKGQLKDLRFATFSFENTSQGKFMLSIIFGYSKYYVDNLSENIRRGIRTKLQHGWLPGLPPLGYFNEPRLRTIVPDPERFPLMRRMWEHMLTGTYSPRQIHEIASYHWGLRTRKQKRRGQKPLSLSAVYDMLTNPFYAGIITMRGATYEGKHQPMVTLDEFERVQALLGRPRLARPKVRTFAFTGMIRCGSCGCAITAEQRTKPSGLTFIYYHCTRKRKPRCAEPAITLHNLEAQIVAFLEGIVIPEEMHRWVLARLERFGSENLDHNTTSRLSVETALQAVTRQSENLTKLRVRDLISDEEFAKEREQLLNERIRLSQGLNNEERQDDWIEPARLLVLFSNRAASWFSEGNHEVKRLILAVAGSNPTLSGRKLNIDAKKPFSNVPNTAEIPLVWTLVKDVRTRWRAHDQDLIQTVAALRRLSELMKPSDAKRTSSRNDTGNDTDPKHEKRAA